MSETNRFRSEHALVGRLSVLSPEELVTLIDGLCQAIARLDMPFFGGVNAANISLDDEGNVGLGEPLAEGNVRYTADQIEYLAPEVFWNNLRSPRADVYSVGMLLYAWSNGGCLPYLYPDASPTDRAEALRRRMSGEAFAPSPVSQTLNRIVDKATAFKAEDRYESVEDLQEAFKAFATEVEESSAAMVAKLDTLKEKQAREAAMMANILAAAQAAANSAAGDTPEPAPKPKQPKPAAPAQKEESKKISLRPLIAVLLIAAILMVAAVAMQFGSAGDSFVDTTANPSGTPVVPTADPDTSPDITPTPTPTSDVTPTPTPTPTPNYDMTPYTLYKADVGWNTAAENCIGAGGTLVSISDKEEFDAVTALADKYGLQAFWVGAFRKSGNIVWLDGSKCSYFPWASGEPTKNNQHFMMLVKDANGTWAYRDMADNGYGSYSGKVGYILEK